MNWTNIKKKYPKVWELFVVFRAKANTIADEKGSRDGDIFKLRDLYDFFDEQGIAISIVWTMHPTEDRLEYYYDFAVDNVAAFESDKHYPSRTEAEEKAFEKAFKILEGEL